MKHGGWLAVVLCGCALQGDEGGPSRLNARPGCLAELGVEAPAIDEAPGDPTDLQMAMAAEQECLAAGADPQACDADQVLTREGALCAAIEAGADVERTPWRLSIVFIERFAQLAWTVQVPVSASSRRNFKLDAFTGETLDITTSSRTALSSRD